MDTQHEKDCQCEDNKPLLPFQSNFAIQLHENEVMRRNPLTTQNRIQRETASNQRPQYPIEYIKQQSMSHTPQQALQHSQQQALQYTRPSPLTEHNQHTHNKLYNFHNNNNLYNIHNNNHNNNYIQLLYNNNNNKLEQNTQL